MLDIIFQLIEKGIAFMVPPTTASHSLQYAYRVRVTVVACAGFVIAVATPLMMFGMTPWFEGFARASDVSAIRVTQIDKDILDYRRQNCDGNVATKQLYMEKIQWLLQEYHRITGQDYRLPQCSDL